MSFKKKDIFRKVLLHVYARPHTDTCKYSSLPFLHFSLAAKLQVGVHQSFGAFDGAYMVCLLSFWTNLSISDCPMLSPSTPMRMEKTLSGDPAHQHLYVGVKVNTPSSTRRVELHSLGLGVSA